MEVQVAVKELIAKAIENLADDATIEDALYQIYVLYEVEFGLAQADAGLTVSHDEVRAIVARWRK